MKRKNGVGDINVIKMKFKIIIGENSHIVWLNSWWSYANYNATIALIKSFLPSPNLMTGSNFEKYLMFCSSQNSSEISSLVGNSKKVRVTEMCSSNGNTTTAQGLDENLTVSTTPETNNEAWNTKRVGWIKLAPTWKRNLVIMMSWYNWNCTACLAAKSKKVSLSRLTCMRSRKLTYLSAPKVKITVLYLV